MSFSDRADRYRDTIDSITREHREASFWLPFDAVELSKTFTEDELAQLEALKQEMEQATDDNERAARLAEKVDEYAETVVKVLKLAKVVAV